MARLIADNYARVRYLIPELAKFGVVGAIGAVIDLGGSAVLHGAIHLGPLSAKAIAVCVATVVTYLGSRFWTFRHRENQPLLREGTLFILLNAVGLLIAELVIGFTVYVLGIRGQVAFNVASVIGTALGTIFRYLTYKRWVFLKPVIPNGSSVAPVLSADSVLVRGDAPPDRVYPGDIPRTPGPRCAPDRKRSYRARTLGGRRHYPLRGKSGRTGARLVTTVARGVSGQEHREHRRMSPGQDDPAAVGRGHRAGQ
jgi:putative flippase GtrA